MKFQFSKRRKPPKLILTLLVRDEEDIIKENILFHLNKGVDHVIATDNRSVDGTTDILREFEKQGVLDYIDEPDDDYSQWKWVTRMAKIAAVKHKADWVINADADEFWFPTKGNLKNELSGIDENVSIVEVKRNDFVALSHLERKFYEKMIYKKSNSLNALGIPVGGKVCHRAFDDVVVKQGNHDLAKPKNLKRIVTKKIEILHFPLRSYKQFENKIKLGGAAYERNQELKKDLGDCWRKLYSDYKNNELYKYFQSSTVNSKEIHLKIQARELLVDERLKNFFKK